jgi:predicted AAA+ superfamily ATPase
MKRIIETHLIAWRDDPNRLPLIIRGARQVGKSYLVENFGKTYFEHITIANFEFQPQLSECFDTLDPQQIIKRLELYTRTNIIPGQTLLFLDEIQNCPNALLALRYFKEKLPQLHVIAAGSLLEFILNSEEFSFPVGRVQFAFLHPMSFSEYLINVGEEKLYQFLCHVEIQSTIPPGIHQQALKLVREYLLIGGMPAAIKTYQDDQSLLSVQTRLSTLFQAYQNDFGKYAKKVNIHLLRRLYNLLPAQIAKQIKYAKLDPETRAADQKVALELLNWAGIIHYIYYSSGTGIPLNAHINEKIFKLLYLDIGLLQFANQIDPKIIIESEITQINAGMLAEQFVGQELIAYGHWYQPYPLFFWKNDRPGSMAEVDYLITLENDIIPIEVKSGKMGKLKSIRQFFKQYNSKMGLKISQDPLMFSDNILSVPFYLIEQLPRLYKDAKNYYQHK